MKILRSLLLLSAMLVGLSSCKKPVVEPPLPLVHAEQTLFVYMPWSSSLVGAFQKNLRDLETAITNGALEGKNKVIVYFMTSASNGTMFEMVYDNSRRKFNDFDKFEDWMNYQRVFKTYDNPAFMTAEGITSILNDAKIFAPADTYSMIVSAHGLGWIPVAAYKSSNAIRPQKSHWEYGIDNTDSEKHLTRFFGDSDGMTDITTLAEGISGAGMEMEYILFDDCYMSGVEVAYDLRHVTDHIIACPTEIMAYGMPYHIIGQHLIGDIDYDAVCKDFVEFYTTFSRPCGTIGVTDCSQLDELAAVMKGINAQFSFDVSQTGSLQTMCGYSPTLFFDCGSYVEALCKDETMLRRFKEQLERTIPYKGHTATYFSASAGEIPIDTYSGTTISDPSLHRWAETKYATSWWKATH